MSEQINLSGVRAPLAMPVRPNVPAQAVPVPGAAQKSAETAALEGDASLRLDARQQLNLSEAVERLNEQMRRSGRGLNFSVDEVAERTVITVKDTQSGEVIRQIPDEALLRVAHNIEEIKGLLYNDMS